MIVPERQESERGDDMRWKTSRRSTNVEDRRGTRLPQAGGIGCVGLLVVLALAYLTGNNPLELLQQVGNAPSVSVGQPAPIPAAGEDTEREFVEAVLGSIEDTWAGIFSRAGRRYEPSVLVLYEDAVQSACGLNSAAVGPFYCPPDRNVYLDLSFFRELERRFGAAGDFAQAYVIAHEVGHHVQNLLGISDQVEQLRRRSGERDANTLSVLVELQADCFAGVWARHAQADNLLEEGDIEEAIRAAQSVGDDFIQKQSQGYVNPDSFTHGSSEQRASWFHRGYAAGDVGACNTMAALRR